MPQIKRQHDFSFFYLFNEKVILFSIFMSHGFYVSLSREDLKLRRFTLDVRLHAWKLKFLFNSLPSRLNLFYQAKSIPLVLPSYPIQIWGKSVKGFLSYDRTYKFEQTNIQTEITFYYISTSLGTQLCLENNVFKSTY